MKQISQNYKSGSIKLEEVSQPALKKGGVLVRSSYSVISIGTEGMKVREGRMSYFGMAKARPDQVKNAIRSVISNPALRARLAANSAHTMAQHYTWPAFRQRFITAFESVTAAPPPNLTVDPSGP